MNIWSRRLRIAGLLGLSAALGACAPKTDVSATGNVPAQYTHLYTSVQEIWFNTSATATPDDTSWAKYTLKTPVTVDLATSMDGTVNPLITGLNVPVGTYAQMRLIPVDASSTLLSSASALGAVYNQEIDYTDASGTVQQSPLELLNPDKGLGVSGTIQVKGDTTNIFASSSSSNSSTTSSTATDSSTSSDSTTSSTGTTTAAPLSLAINLDGATDVVPFTYSNLTGYVLSGHATAYDNAQAGGITGSLDISGLTGVTNASNSGFVNIQVTAETLSADGSRHVAVNSAPVTSTGTFTLYPLATDSSSPVSYDLVIHGPGIQTIVIKAIPVTAGGATAPVNVGALIASGADSFAVNLPAANTAPLPAGALVGFYQTLPGSGEVPYLVAAFPLDPFSRTLQTNQSLAVGNVAYATYAAGTTAALTAAAPTEGSGTYRIAGTAPLFTDGALTSTVKGASGNTIIVNPAPLAAASGATLYNPILNISESTRGKYNAGQVILSHDGAIVATAALDSALATSATGTFSMTVVGVPGAGSATYDPALYYVSVRVWNTASPATIFNREIYPTPLDLRNGVVTPYSLNID